jgi:hypothetical protein
MSEVIDITKRLKGIKERDPYPDHDYVLDACEEVFEHGAVILALEKDGSVSLSSTVEDEKIVVDMLISSALSVQKRLDENDSMD